jgi:hypothetical protein
VKRSGLHHEKRRPKSSREPVDFTASATEH